MSGQEPHSEPPKPSKRKGTRSVSSLTPSQLARKRANDREAQRAIRLRTKEHIERLERELAEYKSGRTQDEWTKLIKRNKELETEVIAMREVLNHLQHNRYPPTVSAAFETDGLPNVGGHTLARAPSFGQGVGDYTSASAPGYPASYLPTPEPCAEWPVSIPTMPVQSNGSSPNSSAGHNEEGTYAQVEYPMPTSIPPMMGVVMPPTSMAGSIPASMAASIPPQLDPSTADQLKYEDMEAAGMRLQSALHLPPQTPTQEQFERMHNHHHHQSAMLSSPPPPPSSSSSSCQDYNGSNMFTNRMLPQAADNQGYPNPNMSQQSAAASYLQQSHGWAHPVYSAGPGYYTTAPAGQTAAI